MSRSPPDPIFTLREHLEPLTALSFLKSESLKCHLISGDQGGTIKIWNLTNFRCMSTVRGYDSSSVLWLENSLHSQGIVFSQGRNDSIRSWNMEMPHPKITEELIQLNNEGFCQCDLIILNNSENIVFPAEVASSVNIYEIKSKRVIRKLKPPEKSASPGMVMCLRCMPRSEEAKILIGYENGCIALWDIRDTSEKLSDIKINDDPVMCLDVELDVRGTNYRGLSGSADDKIRVWKIANNEITILTSAKLHTSGVSCVRIRPDRKICAATCWDGSIVIFSWKTLKMLALLDYHSNIVQCLRFSPSFVENKGNIIAAGSMDQQISLWSIYS